MKSIVVCRTGSPYRINGQGSSANGEFDTQGLIDYLCDAYPGRITYVGLTIGTPRPDLKVIPLDMKGVDEYTTAGELEERFKPMLQFDPLCYINLAGYSPTWSWPDNPNRATTQASAHRYSAPAMYCMHKLPAPRCCVITDPKCYPRDGEISTIWPETRPAAVLSQEACAFPKRIMDKQYTVQAVYAGCEFWGTYGLEVPTRPELAYRVTTAANGHFREARLKGDRTDTWKKVLAGWPDFNSLRICGKHWENWKPRESFVGVIPEFDDVLRLLGSGECGPMISQKKGFTSTKPRLHALMGSVPLFFDEGDHAYDSEARIMPLDWPGRFGAGELLKAYEWARSNWQEAVEEVLSSTTPNFGLLDQMIEELESGEELDADIYGGYVPA